MNDLTALMRAIDECGDRLNAATTMLDNARSVVHDLDIEHAALMRALALAQVAPQPAPVKETKAKEPLPREAAAWAILNVYSTAEIPDGIDDLPAQLREAWNPRTLRAGLNIAHIKRNQSRAAETELDVTPERTGAQEASSSIPHSGAGNPIVMSETGSGCVTVENIFPEQPGFLRRSPTNKAAAE